MTNQVGSLSVDLALETGRLKSDTDKAARHFRRFDRNASRSINGIGRNVRGLTNHIGLLSGALAGLSVAGFGAMIKSSIDAADQIGKLSTRLGASTEALSEYRHVAELSGVSFNTLTMGWQRMTRRVAEAAQGTGEAVKALEELNLNAVELSQLAPDRQFEEITRALSGLNNQADKVRLAMKLFDSEGVSLIQTMEGGVEGLEKMREEARRLGKSMTEDAVKGAENAKDAMARFDAAVTGLSESLALNLAPSLTQVIEYLTNGIPKAAEVAAPAFEGIGNDIKNLWELLNPSGITGGGTISLESALQKSLDIQKQIDAVEASGGRAAVGKEARLEALRAELSHNEMIVARLRERNSIEKEMQIRAEGGGGSGGGAFSVGGAATSGSDGDLTDFGFEDAKTRGELLEQRYYDLRAAQEKEFQMLWEFEDRKTEAVRYGIDQRKKEQERFTRYTELLRAKDLRGALDGAKALTTGLTRENKLMFKANKIASIATATMDAYAAFNKALAQGGIWGYAKAAAIFATAMSNVSAIESTSFGGSGSSGVPSLATSGGEPGNPVVQNQGQQETGRTFNIQFLGPVFGAEEETKRYMAEMLGELEYNDQLIVQ